MNKYILFRWTVFNTNWLLWLIYRRIFVNALWALFVVIEMQKQKTTRLIKEYPSIGAKHKSNWNQLKNQQLENKKKQKFFELCVGLRFYLGMLKENFT